MMARWHGAGLRVGLLFLLLACQGVFALNFDHELRNQDSNYAEILTTLHKRPTVTRKKPSKHVRMIVKRTLKRRRHRA